jgi:hypothetical protein
MSTSGTCDVPTLARAECVSSQPVRRLRCRTRLDDFPSENNGESRAGRPKRASTKRRRGTVTRIVRLRRRTSESARRWSGKMPLYPNEMVPRQIDFARRWTVTRASRQTCGPVGPARRGPWSGHRYLKDAGRCTESAIRRSTDALLRVLGEVADIAGASRIGRRLEENVNGDAVVGGRSAGSRGVVVVGLSAGTLVARSVPSRCSRNSGGRRARTSACELSGLTTSPQTSRVIRQLVRTALAPAGRFGRRRSVGPLRRWVAGGHAPQPSVPRCCLRRDPPGCRLLRRR